MAKRFDLGEALKASVGEASVANMTLGEDQFADAGKLPDEDITQRVLQLKADAGNAILEIGRWLTVMKSRKGHGEWLEWLERVDIRERAAQRFMQLAREYSANPSLVTDLGQTKALMLLAIPSEEREAFAEETDAAALTKDELAQAIRERDEARKALDTAMSDVKNAEEFAAALAHERDEAREVMDAALSERDEAQARVHELESAPKDVYRDEAAIKEASEKGMKAGRTAAAAEWSAKVADAEAKAKELEDKLAKAKEKAKTAGADAGKEAERYKAEAEALRAQLEAAKREEKKAAVSGDADLAAFRLLFEQGKETANKLRGLLLKVRGRGDDELAGKLQTALLALADAVRGCAE